MDGPQQANSGHPGTAMALAPLGWSLYGRAMQHNPANPKWPNRDRFVLSCGHACILQYSLLHLCGYDLSLDDLRAFRQWHSKTPGHPENWVTPGVETTTGPLGQGISNAVGMAIAERWLASHFNRPGHEIVDHHTYVICSDGDLMEGVSSESGSLAGQLKVGKLICLYDDNKITIEGDTHLAFTEDVDARYRAYGWHVQRLDSPNDLEAVQRALEAAKADPRPSLIAVRTHIAFPAPHAVDTHQAHGAPLGDTEIQATKAVLGLPPAEKFYVAPELDELRTQIKQRGAQAEAAWNQAFEAYAKQFPELAVQFQQFHSGHLPEGWDADLKVFEPGKGMATRVSSGKVINQVCNRIANLLGGSADLAPSTMTWMDGLDSHNFEHPGGRNFHFGIREHGMGSIVNGMLLHGGVRAFCATFFVFSDYMRPAVRLAALIGLPAIYVWTHDSIGLGEDGPTHQAVEHLASLRAMPNLWVMRPGDANEVLESWKVALQSTKSPVALVLSRQGVPTFDRGLFASAEGVHKGAYILAEADGGAPRCILIGTGTELQHCVKARELLQAEGVPTRVVSMPCWELFEQQSKEYRQQVLPKGVAAKVAVEAGCSFGWERWIGENGATVCVDKFGASAPWETNMQKYGFTAENVVAVAKSVLA
ncbi:transketolase [bacterium]|nr:transketolase [bacterium]